MMPIRPTTPDDFKIVQALYLQLFEYELENGDPYMDLAFPFHGEGEQYLRDSCANQNGRAAFVYEKNGKVIAYASLRAIPETEYAHRKDIKPMQLQTLVVDKDHRHQGVGEAMMKRATDIAKDNGITHLRVSALAKNDRARHLYKQCGFDEFEIVHEIKI